MRSVKVANIEYIPSDDYVYDIMVENNHNFFTNGGVLSSNCYVILDEAQNTTPSEMKLFVTRAGVYSYFVVNGDGSQCDLQIEENGLDWLIRRIAGKSSMINVIQFGNSDIQRSELVKELLLHLDGPDDKNRSIRHKFY
jgi:phosphate starvation-inducible protein PhoH